MVCAGVAVKVASVVGCYCWYGVRFEGAQHDYGAIALATPLRCC